MMQRFLLSRRNMLFSLAGLLVTAMLSIWGCGGSSSSYTDPAASANITTTKTANALIDAATLKGWMDEGKVNAPFSSYDRVVILSLGPATDPSSTSATTYTSDKIIVTTTPATTYGYTNHIPGAQLWNTSTELTYTRREAVADIGTMVPDGATIDALVKRFGITKYTTIVLTVSRGQNHMYAARAYYTLRYWGFPKERIKVLDGGDNAWQDAGYALTTTVPNITASTYSVRNNFSGSYSNFNFRTSIGEMIAVVDKINAGTESVADANGISVLDARGGTDWSKSRIANATFDDYNAYTNAAVTSTVTTTIATTTVSAGTTVNTTGTASISKTRKYLADLVTYMGTRSVTSAKKMNYVYCASGVRASVPFFVLDGVLGWPVSLYDGSWNQWSGYRALYLPDAGGVASIWRVENPANLRTAWGSESALTGSLPISDSAYLSFTSVLDPNANQMFQTDKVYFETPPVSSTTGGGATGGASGC